MLKLDGHLFFRTSHVERRDVKSLPPKKSSCHLATAMMSEGVVEQTFGVVIKQRKVHCGTVKC